jgi:hypothetical protein
MFIYDNVDGAEQINQKYVPQVFVLNGRESASRINCHMKNFKFYPIFIATLSFCLVQCSSDNYKKDEVISSKYQLEEFVKKTNLTPYVANFAVYDLSVEKISVNSFKVTTSNYDLSTVNKYLKSYYYIDVVQDGVVLKTTIDNVTYKFLKNDIRDETFFQIDDEKFLINEDFFTKMSTDNTLVFSNLVSVYIELYDIDAKRFNSEVTKKVAASIANKTASGCLKFESGVGLTGSGSKLRASMDTQEYISDGNSDCIIVGSDTSCVVDSHVCITTVTMSCSTSCSWWN